MASVTIVGSAYQSLGLTFDATANFALAKQIADQISAGVKAGTITTTTDSTQTIPTGQTGSYLQTAPGAVFLPPAYTSDNINLAGGGSALVFGSAADGQSILSDENTNLTFIATAGSGTVVAGGGNNQLRVGSPGGWSLNTGNGNDIIAATGSGNNTIAAGGGNNSIQLGSGQDLVISTGDDSIQGGTGSATVDATGAHSDFVQGMSAHLLFVGGVGGTTILGGSGSDTYFGSNAGPTGKQYIVGGTAGNNLLWAGDGAATLVGGGDGDQLYAYGDSSQVLIAGAGNESLSATFSNGADSLRAGSGNDQLIGGTGADTFVGGSGYATVSAGSGPDVYEFIKGHAGGSEVVQGLFQGAPIAIQLQGYGPGADHAALASQTTSGGNVTISLNDGTKITFDDVTSLTKSNFV